MKKFTPPHFLLIVIALLISVASCTNDVEVDTISPAKQQQVTFEKISFNALFQQIKSEKVRANVQMVKENLAITASRGIELDSLYFTKIVKENEYTTYLLELNSYTIDEPYFLKYVITQTDREEKAGYIKYIPEEEIPYIEPHNFTGTIQLLDDTFTVRSENYFINGVEKEILENTNASRGIDGCTSTTRIIQHNCSNGGNHAPGVSCDEGYTNDGYFEIIVTVICPSTFPTYDNSPFPAQLIDIGGPSSGGGNSTTPNPNNSFNPTAFKVYRTLSPTQKQWWDNVATTTEKNDITNYLEQNSHFSDLGILVFNEDAIAFVQQLIDQALLNPNLNFDVKASANSPANIDRSAIDNNSPEGQRFNEVYDALKNVPEFKTLFTDIFDGPQTRLNVKFEIHEHVYHKDLPNSFEVSANTKSSNNQNANNYIIKINKQGLIANGTIVQNKLENAQTIVHEAAHAFLHHLLKNPNSIATIQNIDQKDLKEILDALQSVNPNQHQIIFNNLTETIAEILSSLKDVLITPAQRVMVEDLQIPESQDPQNPNSQIWN